MKLTKLAIILAALLTSIPAVMAQDIGSTVGRFMYKIFGWVFVDVSGSLGDRTVEFAMRFLIWLLLFALFFFGVSKVFQSKKNIQVTVAACLSLMGAILIPTAVLIRLLKTYGGVTVILLFGIPIAAILYINKFAFPGMARAECALKAVSIYLLATIFHNMMGLEQSLEFANMDAWVGFAEAVCIIAMIVYIFCAILGWDKDNEGTEGGSDGGEGGSDGGGGSAGTSAAGGSTPGAAVQQTPRPAGAAFCPEITNVDPNAGCATGRVRI
ncbi:MAG: hypothetical protein KJ601_02615 [Nanoarchaeota archaeon]|nr:hypothetical protein [Nanoarchaeota archaeon]